MRSMVPASPPPIQVAPMQATASNEAGVTPNAAGVGPHEPDPVGHPQVSGPGLRRGHEDLADIHAQAPDPVPLRPGAEHLALPAAQVEQAHVPPPLAELAQQLQLLVGKRVQDPVARLGYLVLAQQIHGAPSAVGTVLGALRGPCSGLMLGDRAGGPCRENRAALRRGPPTLSP